MLEVPYERSVRRIAAEVTERPRGSLYLAVGSSAEVRAAVEDALEERAPGLAVVRATLHEEEGPWARILAAREESGRPASEVIVSVAGLGDMAEERLDGILAHLNLGRELRVVHRLHVLLWVGRLERLDRFRTGAPDLWGHRSSVELFLSHEDFEVAFEDTEPAEVPRPKSVEAHLLETEAELALSPRPARRGMLLVYKAADLHDLGHEDEALLTVEEAESLLVTPAIYPSERAVLHAQVAVRKLVLLRATKRSDEALRYAMNLDRDPLGDPILHQLVKGELGRLNMLAGRVVESISYFDDALEPLSTAGDRAANFGVRAQLFEQCGALDAAAQAAVTASEEAEQFRGLVETLQPQDEHTKMQLLQLPVLSVDDTQARVCFARGDALGALTHAHRGVARVLALGVTRIVLSTLGVVAGIYGSLGLLGDARWFAHRASEILENSPGDLAWWTRWLGARDMEEGQIQAAITRYESAVSLYRTAARAEHGAHGRASWLREAAVVLFDDLAPLSDAAHCCAVAEDLLADAARAADEAASPEQRALTQRSRAALAEARKQWDLAETGFLSFLPWAQANWGPYKRAEVLLDLATVARERGDLTRASEHAEHAQREVAIDPPEHRNRFVAIDAARELARIRMAQGDSTRAHAALDAALAIARGDDLRLREREILLDLAELPPPLDGPDRRIEHAQRARGIAQDAAFPVDEAEAMLVLAELHHDAGHARRARALFEQCVWIVDRIGPRAVRERALRLRDKLGG